MANKIRLKMVKSINSCTKNQQACIKGLGLRKIGHIVELEDTPSVRGMYNKVNFLVKLLED